MKSPFVGTNIQYPTYGRRKNKHLPSSLERGYVIVPWRVLFCCFAKNPQKNGLLVAVEYTQRKRTKKSL